MAAERIEIAQRTYWDESKGKYRLQIRTHKGSLRYLIFADDRDAKFLERAIDVLNAEDAGLDDIPAFDAAEDKPRWWRDTLGRLATDAAKRGDATTVAKLAQSASGFENVAKLKAAVQKLMAHIQMLQSGQKIGKRRGA